MYGKKKKKKKKESFSSSPGNTTKLPECNKIGDPRKIDRPVDFGILSGGFPFCL